MVSFLVALSFALIQFLTKEDNTITSVVYLDLNPSFAFSLNEKNVVLALDSLNEEADLILGDTDFVGNSIEDTLRALSGVLNLHGYFQDNSTLLLTVEDASESRGESLSVSLKEQLDIILQTHNGNVTTVGLWADPALGYAPLAEELGVSMGKMIFMEELGKLHFFFQPANLQDFSYGELYQLYALGEGTLPLGLAEAMELGLSAVNLSLFDDYFVDIKSKFLDETPHYEVFFQKSGQTGEYLVTIHAFEGTILDTLERPYSGQKLGYDSEEAKEIALSHASKLEYQVEGLSVIQDWSQGGMQYAVSFQAQDMVHRIQVLGAVGTVVSHDIRSVQEEPLPPLEDLGATAITSIVYGDAGILRNQVTETDFQRSMVEGEMLYTMKFWVGSVEYYYEVTGSGQILHSHQSHSPDREDTVTSEDSTTAPMTETKAKDLALAHANSSFSAVTEMSAQRQEAGNEAGNYVVRFQLDGFQYTYLISGMVSEEEDSILSYEKEAIVTTAGESAGESAGEGITAEAAKLTALAHANLKEVMIQQIDITEEEGAYVVAFPFGQYDFRYEVSKDTGEILTHAITPVYKEPEEVTPEPTQAELEAKQESFNPAIEDFNNYLAEFDSNMSQNWESMIPSLLP